mmetsp:Transcript_1619/g.2772  ORF Transcript_1619/g.2772 Transcript_1619/m.2772 type:complete len:109 (+) Transcript_1619:209-535(+)
MRQHRPPEKEIVSHVMLGRGRLKPALQVAEAGDGQYKLCTGERTRSDSKRGRHGPREKKPSRNDFCPRELYLEEPEPRPSALRNSLAIEDCRGGDGRLCGDGAELPWR